MALTPAQKGIAATTYAMMKVASKQLNTLAIQSGDASIENAHSSLIESLARLQIAVSAPLQNHKPNTHQE
jgi:hypothetical protein